MIELRSNRLAFTFPDIHPDARCAIDFQRTLRIPDDNNAYPLPPGLGRFPVLHVDDYANKVPPTWQQHGGVFIPMYQSEALWINFHGEYPCAIKIAAGKINAVDGNSWSRDLSEAKQDYVVIPEQPWLDGFNVTEDYIRQFVAMPLGEGFSAEEQLTGKAEHGGLQLLVYPMKSEHYEKLVAERENIEVNGLDYFMSASDLPRSDDFEMGLAPGGLMEQKIYDDPHGYDAWDLEHGQRCFVHLVNSSTFTQITGALPPQAPVTAADYTEAGLPWFDYYADAKPVKGSATLASLDSVGAKIIHKTGKPLVDNTSPKPVNINHLGPKSVIRQGEF